MSAVRPVVRRIALAAVVLLAAVGLTSASATGRAQYKDEYFVTAQTSGILDIEAGECFLDPAYLPGAAEVVVLYTPCPGHADNQSYGFVHAADGPWDRAKLAAFGWHECGTGFAARWSGRPDLKYYPILPTEETWADGDRDVMCVVYSPEGTLKDSALPRN